jgi:hypothetical protein
MVEVGVTVTLTNAGDYTHQTPKTSFTFAEDGQITYKRWLHAGTPFVGTASVIACH